MCSSYDRKQLYIDRRQTGMQAGSNFEKTRITFRLMTALQCICESRQTGRQAGWPFVPATVISRSMHFTCSRPLNSLETVTLRCRTVSTMVLDMRRCSSVDNVLCVSLSSHLYWVTIGFARAATTNTSSGLYTICCGVSDRSVGPSATQGNHQHNIIPLFVHT